MIDNSKIFILINSSRELDYYKNILKCYPNKFEIIINNHNNQINFLNINNSKYFNQYCSVRSFYGKKIDVLISTGLGHLRVVTFKSLIKFFYANTIGRIFELLKLDELFYKLFKRKFTAGGIKSSIYDLVQIEKKISKYNICYPRGLDINLKIHPEPRWRKTFDFFFCHSNIDANAIKKNSRKPNFIIGYPRYNLKKKKLFKQNKKGKLLWMPSFGKYSDDELFNIKKWLQTFLLLKEKYEITLKVHPKVNIYKNLVMHLKKNFIFIDNQFEDLNLLYKKNDIVICDAGGTIFSAIYNEKPVVLLEEDYKKFGINSHNLDYQIRSKLPYIKRYNKYKLIEKINYIFQNYSKKILEIKKIKKVMFGNKKNISNIIKKLDEIKSKI